MGQGQNPQSAACKFVIDANRLRGEGPHPWNVSFDHVVRVGTGHGVGQAFIWLKSELRPADMPGSGHIHVRNVLGRSLAVDCKLQKSSHRSEFEWFLNHENAAGWRDFATTGDDQYSFDVTASPVDEVVFGFREKHALASPGKHWVLKTIAITVT